MEATQEHADVQPARSPVGRSSLTQQLASDDTTAKPGMFESAPAWEDIGHAEQEAAQAGGEDSSLASLEASDDHETADEVAGVGDSPDGGLQASDESTPAEPDADAIGGGDAGADADVAEAAEAAEAETSEAGEPRSAALLRAAAGNPDAATTEVDAVAPPLAVAAQAQGQAAPAPAAPAPAASAAPVPTGPAHRGKFERRVKKASSHFAKQDAYNKRRIRGHAKTNPNQIGRPGVRVGTQDKMDIVPATALRYRIVEGNKGEAVDQISKAEIAAGQRLALNPARVRMLVTDGQPPRPYVLCWYGIQSSAWIGLHDLAGNQHNIRVAVEKQAKAWGPKRASAKNVKRMQFRPVDDPIAKIDASDDRDYILQNQKGVGNNVADYLAHQTPTKFAAPGAPTRQSYNVTMNLPQADAPPVAIDVVAPGDFFFVVRGKQFQREIAIYAPRAKQSKRRQTWVYGFVAKQDTAGRPTPDKARFGWVPLRCVK
ncbi:MAG: hypothetical protein H0X17_19660 [Deltaproteobacteria bacterium]|nr:hypothetical protein [Deltaproteobacteria bacterium]